jgi:hypothetical protein
LLDLDLSVGQLQRVVPSTAVQVLPRGASMHRWTAKSEQFLVHDSEAQAADWQSQSLLLRGSDSSSRFQLSPLVHQRKTVRIRCQQRENSELEIFSPTHTFADAYRKFVQNKKLWMR